MQLGITLNVLPTGHNRTTDFGQLTSRNALVCQQHLVDVMERIADLVGGEFVVSVVANVGFVVMGMIIEHLQNRIL